MVPEVIQILFLIKRLQIRLLEEFLLSVAHTYLKVTYRIYTERCQEIVYPLRAITLRDYIQDDYPYTAIALAERLLERYPDDQDLRMLLGDAWQRLGPRSEFAPDDFSNRDKRRNLRRRVFKTRQERTEELLATPEGQAAFTANLEQARVTYESILSMDATYAPAHRGLGEVYQALGDAREAGRHYLEYVRAAPDAADRPVVMGRLTTIRDTLAREKGNETN
jgi:tetratricopeptide (TPR) repeat protein